MYFSLTDSLITVCTLKRFSIFSVVCTTKKKTYRNIRALKFTPNALHYVYALKNVQNIYSELFYIGCKGYADYLSSIKCLIFGFK